MGKKLVFGLPGHPVSAAVCFDLFVRPVISHISGIAKTNIQKHRTVQARLTRNLNSAPGRRDYVRVQLKCTEDKVFEAHPVLAKSGALSSMVKAHGYLMIPENSQGVYEGATVNIMLFD